VQTIAHRESREKNERDGRIDDMCG
jgi:hypothetical protein